MLIVCFVFIAVLTACDQLLKLWAVQCLQPAETISILRIGGKDVLQLRYLENSGAAFGNFAGKKWALIIITVILLAVCVVWLVKKYRASKFFALSCSTVIAGALGNLIDRVFRDGLVVDYIDVTCIHFPVFNFADCCVVVGVILLAVYILFLESDKKPESTKELEENAGA